MAQYTPQFLEAQKARLLEAEKKILADLREIAVYDEETGTWTPLSPEYDEGYPEDPADAAEEATDLRSNEARVNDLTVSLEEIRKALQKMERGKYGLCENCGEYIDARRLRAYPAAPSCLKCSA